MGQLNIFGPPRKKKLSFVEANAACSPSVEGRCLAPDRRHRLMSLKHPEVLWEVLLGSAEAMVVVADL